MAAVELAKSPDDYAAAIEEFEKAAKLAPDWPGIYYNLGLIQEKAGNYSNAVMSLLRYIHLAPNASDAETVKSLINKLEYKFELLYKENGYSLLHDVARNNNKEGAELLIAKGADINAKDNDGETPLHNAINSNSMEVVELLIVNGADLDAKDNAGYSPLHKAIISQVSKEVIELLISNGVDINIKNQFGCIPLHYAARGGQKEVVELLITKGADINAKDNTGTTPLHYAVFQLRKEVVELLLGNGADINAKDNKGKTALFYAINVDKGLAKLLKEHGAK
jgi:ankyrin repeat protein